MSWNSKTNAKEGVRGYQKVSDSEKMNYKSLIAFTKDQSDLLNLYCNENNISKSELIRGLLHNHFKESGYLTRIKQPEDKRQLNIIDEIEKQSNKPL